MKYQNLKRVVQGALMIALATVLSLFKLFSAPFGGSVTFGSMVPIILFALVYETKWGMFVGFAYGLLQLLLGLSSIAGISFEAWIGSALLDYVVAYAVLGLAGIFARRFRDQVLGAGVGAFAVCFLRFLCSFFSGILIWGDYAPAGQPVWLYSLLYNGGFMLFETLITVTLIVLMISFLPLKRMGLGVRD